jgi:hypothetical protein
MASTPSLRRRRRLKLAALVLSPVLSVVALEGVFRYRAWRHNESLESAFLRLPETAPTGRTRFFDVIQPHPSDRIIYELRPDLDVEYSGVRLLTNSLGFIGPELAALPDENAITVVGIGASIMFGKGVEVDESFFAVLEQLVQSRYPERAWRFVNTSVPSYNLVMKVESLKRKGLQFRPDLVVLEIASNNLDLPNYVRVADEPLDLGRSFILDYFRERRGIGEETRKRYEVLAPVDRPKLSWDGEAVTDPSRIPPQYRDLVGWDPFNRALDELKELSARHGFEVLVVTHLEIDLMEQMLREVARRGFPVVSGQPDLDEYFRTHFGEEFNAERYCASGLVVNTSNRHPSVLQHRMLGMRLAYEVARSGLIARLMARAPPRPVPDPR